MPEAIDLYTELRRVLEVLEAAGLPYALGGGLAVAFHGYPRFTKDIDLLVQPADVAAAKTLLARLGFGLVAEPTTFGADSPAERVVHRVSKVVGARS